MKNIEKTLQQKFTQLSPDIAPGFVLRVYHTGQKVCDTSWGKTWTYYDLASLSKIFFTVPWMMRSVHLDRIDIFRTLPNFMPWYPYKTVIKNLLSHSAGNAWWQPFYKMVDLQNDTEVKKLLFKTKLREQAPALDEKKAVYSDLDFFLLGFLLETVYEKTWLELWEELAETIFKKQELFFHPQNKIRFAQDLYAPTEKCPWRGKILQGEVHDENAWALDGVAPHAGLFGSVDAVGEWALWLRQEYYGLKNTWTSKALTQKFAARAIPADRGDWSLGFMMPTEGSASCGSYFSPQSFGHTGFTGTSFWMDPQKDLIVILLSNRIHPTRQNELFKKARPQIHNWVCEELGVVQ
jgi:serine-type D-Ala-D-Ala carboxypeptidase